MKSKVTIMTPVHVGTGENAMGFEYFRKGNTIYHYDIQHIFSQLPSSKILDPYFLNTLANQKSDGSKRNYLNKYLGNIDYNKIPYEYSLTFNFEHGFIQEKNVSIQIKSLDKPIIPGSTLKGAIMNSIAYDFVKNHYQAILTCLKIGDFNQKKLNMETFFDFIYPNLSKDFLKRFANCIVCSDISFENLTLLQTFRGKITDNNAEIPTPDFECLEVGEIKSGDFISFNEIGKNILREVFCKEKFYDEFVQYLNYESIIRCANQYFKDMTEEEILSAGEYYASNTDMLKSFCNHPLQNGFYLRIGSGTNYFFKTVSYLFKKKDIHFYADKFYTYFSPKGVSKKGAFPKPYEMPITRMILMDQDNEYYPGIIKVEFDV